MKILLAVSGGIDSMCMADKYQRMHTDEISIAHCNFHLRGEESELDSLLVSSWAEERRIQFFRADFDTAAYARQEGLSIEMAARELRYRWFASIAKEHGFDAVAVAHNSDDNAETFLLNLLRGSGGRGLRGMKRESLIPGTEVPLLRPMLELSRAEIESYASEHGVPYRTDSTNLEDAYRRNLLRHKVLPVFEKINPSFLRTMTSDMEHISQENDIAQDYFESAKEKIIIDGNISVPLLVAQKHWKYLIYRLTEDCAMSTATLASLCALLQRRADGEDITFAGKSFRGSEGAVLTGADSLRLVMGNEKKEESVLRIEAPGVHAFLGHRIEVSIREAAHIPVEAGTIAWDADALPLPFTLTVWKDGDWMKPLGMGGRRKKLSDLFCDMKMDLTQKRTTPVVVMEDGEKRRIGAVLPFRLDEKLKVTESTSRTIILRIV